MNIFVLKSLFYPVLEEQTVMARWQMGVGRKHSWAYRFEGLEG